VAWGPAPPSPSALPPHSGWAQKEKGIISFSCISACFLPAPRCASHARPDPGQNQVPWPTWADVLGLISPSPPWASWGMEPAPVCTSPMNPGPINVFPHRASRPSAAQVTLLGSPCGPMANGCCMDKCLSWPSPCSICTEQGPAS